MENKKAEGLSLQTIIILIIAIVVLAVILFIFSDQVRGAFTSFGNIIKEIVGLSENIKIE